MPDDHTLSAALRRLERERATGVLHVGDDGAFHLAAGAVVHAESAWTAGPLTLARASGHGVPPEPAAVAAALGGPLLETFALLATFDAAYFLFGSAAEAAFEEGPPHWLAPYCRITPATLAHEYERRRRRLTAVAAPEGVDRAPVAPVRRIRRQRVILTGLQAELLLNADGRRTPTELARDLGRGAFACLLAVRELAAEGLVEPPQEGTARLPRRRAAPPPADPPEQWEPVDHDVLVRLRSALEELA